jgi:hypothetical protein
MTSTSRTDREGPGHDPDEALADVCDLAAFVGGSTIASAMAKARVRHRRGRAGAEALAQASLVVPLHDLVDRDAPLFDPVAGIAKNLQRAVARDAGEDRSRQRRSENAIVEDEEDVHDSTLLDVSTFLRIEPQHRREARPAPRSGASSARSCPRALRRRFRRGRRARTGP